MDTFEKARLIPVSGIQGNQEAEQRVASALLAVMTVVRPFSASLLAHAGATRAASAWVETFTEPVFELDGRSVRPDGLVEVHIGKRVAFAALVEIKTGLAKLDADQINAYLDVARAENIDCVVTISNEVAPSAGVHPTAGLHVRSNSKVAVRHLSWALILSEAVKEHAHRGVDDPEQAWLLNELIRYLSHPKSGVLELAGMSKTSDGPPNGRARSARRSMTATTTPRSISLPTRGETTLHAVCAVADGAQSGLRSSGVQKQDPNPPPPLGATGRELGTSPRRLQHQMLNGSPEAGTRRGGPAVKDTRTREHRISAEPLEPRDGVHKSKRQQTPRFRVTACR